MTTTTNTEAGDIALTRPPESPLTGMFVARRKADQARFELNRAMEGWVCGNGAVEAVLVRMAAFKTAVAALEVAIDRQVRAGIAEPVRSLEEVPFHQVYRGRGSSAQDASETTLEDLAAVRPREARELRSA